MPMTPHAEHSTKSGAGTASAAAAAPARERHSTLVHPALSEASYSSSSPTSSDSPQIRFCRRLVQIVSLLTVSIGTVMLLDRTLGITILTSLLPRLITMKPNAAVCFIIAGLALWLLRDADRPLGPGTRLGVLAGGVVLGVGAVTALEIAFRLNFGIDEWLFHQTLLATGVVHPGRMSLASALGFTLLGLSLMLLAAGNKWSPVRQVAAVLCTFDGLMALVGYLYGVEALYGLGTHAPIAVQTSAVLALLGIAALAARPDDGVAGIITSEFLGGLLTRRVLPLALTLPMLLGWIRWQGELAGYYGTRFGLAIFTLSNMVMLTTLLIGSAAWINRTDERRRWTEQADLRLAAIVESSTDAIVGKDLNGVITSWNTGAERLFGYSSAEIVGQSMTKLIPVDRHGEEKEILARIRRGERVESFETVRVRKDGQQLEISANISPVKDQAGRVIGASKIARDISARRQEEATLQRSLRIAGQALKDLADQNFALDQHAIVAITDVQGTITYVNNKFCDISQYSQDELIGSNHRILNSGFHPKEFFQEMYRTIAGGKVWHAEIKNRAKDGSFYWVDTTVVPTLNAAGKPQQYVAIRTDITQQKRAEEALREQAQDLARSNGDLEQFAYAASHDLQEPLRAVAGCMQLLKARYEGKIDARADEFITHAVDGATRMQRLIDDLLAFSRVGTRGVELQPVACQRALENALKNLSVAIETSGAQIECDALPMVMGDLSQLALLFQNLIGNALKFRGLKAPRIYVGAQPQGREWVLSVRDNGIGIDPQYFERIFVIFQRLHTRKEYPGTGMGLALCKKIVERHGGKICLDSKLGAGTTFRFTLPASNPWSGR